MATHKATKIEKEKRILQVIEAILQGYSDVKIEQLIKQNWKLTIRQARNYKSEAYKRLRRQNDSDIEERREAKIQEIQEKCRLMDEKHFRTPQGLNAYVNAQKLIVKLDDLEPEKKIKLSGDAENPISIVWHEEKTYLQPEEETDDE